MRPFNALRRAPALAGVALLTSFAAGGVAAAGTDPAPPAGTSTASSGTGDSSPDIPGGEIPEALTEGTWFDDEGRLWSPEASSVSDDKHAAFCDFLFGTPDEIAEAFGLDGLELVEGSGFEVRGGGGTGFQCGYDPAESETTDLTGDSSLATDVAGANDAPDATDGVDSEGGEASSDPDEDDDQPMIVFVVWSEPLEVDDEAEGIAEVFVVDGGDEARSAGLAITDEFDGEMIDAAFADAWLTTARDRLA